MSDTANSRLEYITIVGNSFEDVAEECRAQRLSENDYAIVHPISRHRFTMAGQGNAAMNGQSLVSATFARRAAG